MASELDNFIIDFLSEKSPEKEDNSNSGMMTKIWGPGLWVGMHSISFGYPIIPSDEQKKKYKDFFTLVADVLPCGYCRESYKNFITTEPTILNDQVMTDRKSLTKWLFDLHNRVNDKLGVDYDLTYEDVAKRYESYRALCVKTDRKATGCTTPLNIKSKSFIRARIKDCPIIPYEDAINFKDYCIKREISQKEIDLMGKYNEFRKSKNNKVWITRNIECDKIINEMRYKSIPSKETDGKFKGLPTKDELRLICRLSTNLCIDEIKTLSNRLEQNQAGGKKKNIINGKRKIKKYYIKK